MGHAMIEPDPPGYQITYGPSRDLVVTRQADQYEVGRYPTREEAVEAARADAEAQRT